jgi:hypothetical protein
MQPRSEEFRAHAAEYEELAKCYGGLIELAEQAETSNWRRPLIVRDPVLLCAAPSSYP